MDSVEARVLASKYAPVFAQKVSNEWALADQIAPEDFGEPDGLVDGLITVAHKNIYLHTEPRRPTDVGDSRPAFENTLRVVKFNETVDGNIWLD